MATRLVAHSIDSVEYFSSQVSQPEQLEEGSLSSRSNIEGGTYKLDELDGSSASTPQKVAAELLGTFILVFVGCASSIIDQRNSLSQIGVPIVWGTTVVVLIYTVGHISGAHFNPAVSVAFSTSGRFPWKMVPLYVIAQFLGSIFASVALRWLFDGDRIEVILSLPSSSATDLESVAWEIITSFILMFVVCGAADDDRANKQLAGVAVGAAVFLDALIAGKISGASMNPARSFGPAAATGNFKKIWIYMIAPIVGTVSGSTVYHFLRLPGKNTKYVKNEPKNMNKWVNAVYNEKSIEIA